MEHKEVTAEYKETARKILEALAESFTGKECKGGCLLEWINNYLNGGSFEPDEDGELNVLYRYLDVARSLIEEQMPEPTIYIVDKKIDYKDTMYVIFDSKKEAVLDYGWFKWESEPFESVSELLSYIVKRYEKMRERIEKLYGTFLQPLDPGKVAEAGEKLYRELKEEAQKSQEKQVAKKTLKR